MIMLSIDTLLKFGKALSACMREWDAINLRETRLRALEIQLFSFIRSLAYIQPDHRVGVGMDEITKKKKNSYHFFFFFLQ